MINFFENSHEIDRIIVVCFDKENSGIYERLMEELV